MSTKQTIIFIFMLIFLGVLLTAIGMYFHFDIELSVRLKAIEALKVKKALVAKRKTFLTKYISNAAPSPEDPPTLPSAFDDIKQQADAKETEVYGDLENMYKSQVPEIQAAWASSKDEYLKVYADWKTKNARLKEKMGSLVKQQSEFEKRLDDQKALYESQVKKEKEDRRALVLERRGWSEELEKIRFQSEVLQDKINGIIRELSTTKAFEKDGTVIFSDPAMKTVRVNIGYEHGLTKDTKFAVYSGLHTTPVFKGEIQITDVGPLASDAVILPGGPQPKTDPVTGWVAPDAEKRYSVYSSGEEGPTELIKPKTHAERVEDIRLTRLRQEDPEEFNRQIELKANPTTPPIELGTGFDPIGEGDWLVNDQFIPIVTKEAFAKKVEHEILDLRDVSVGTVTFYLGETIRPYRREYLKRLCERFNCKVASAMSPDVDYIVATSDSTDTDAIKRRIEAFKDNDSPPRDILNRRAVLNALLEGERYGTKVMTEGEMETYFLHRERKVELITKDVTQPSIHTFYVVGETQRRSVRETCLFIQELGGIVSEKLDDSVDYVVVGQGLENAKYDVDTGRIYWGRNVDDAPAGAEDFFKGIRGKGYRILREGELETFFGREEPAPILAPEAP